MTDHDMTNIIRSYWQERGYTVKVDVRECRYQGPGGGVFIYHAVRSDMLGGLPRGYRGDEAALADPRAA